MALLLRKRWRYFSEGHWTWSEWDWLILKWQTDQGARWWRKTELTIRDPFYSSATSTPLFQNAVPFWSLTIATRWPVCKVFNEFLVGKSDENEGKGFGVNFDLWTQLWVKCLILFLPLKGHCYPFWSISPSRFTSTTDLLSRPLLPTSPQTRTLPTNRFRWKWLWWDGCLAFLFRSFRWAPSWESSPC